MFQIKVNSVVNVHLERHLMSMMNKGALYLYFLYNKVIYNTHLLVNNTLERAER